jgi:V8-like Glu-specific endopeptidase
VHSGRRIASIPKDLRDAPADLAGMSRQDIADQDIEVPEVGQPVAAEPRIQQVAIYGKNTLSDYYKVDKSLQQLADSVVALMDKSALVYDEADGVYKIPNLTTVNQRMGITRGSTFAGQKTVSFCSGSLVADNIVLTAGHCVNNKPEDPHYFEKIYVVFGWKQTGSGKYATTFAPEQVYEAKGLIAHKLEGNIGDMDSYRDYALISLSRAVAGKSPLTIDRTHGESVRVGAKVFHAGYPMGMSVKITAPDDASVKAIGKNGYATDIDAFGGSSGGPVFDSATRRIAGVLITANAKQFKYTAARDVKLRYKVNPAPGAKLDFPEDASGVILSVPQADLAGITNTMQAAGCTVDAATITYPHGYSYYNNEESFVNQLLAYVAKQGDLRGAPVQLPAYEGIGTGAQKIDAIIEMFTPFTAEENRKCAQIRAKMNNNGVINPAFMMLYKANKCDTRQQV